jgi:hypothetical protein
MPTADLTINGSDGPITVTAGDPLNLSWTSSNVATCESTGDGWNNASQSLTGSEVVSATVTGTYELTCHDSSAVTDSVDVTVNPAPNAPPATPTITGPTTREENESGSYDTTATDPDGDQIQYEYDWDNDGVVDQTTTLMPSGSTDTQTRSWATAGTYTFNARAVDSNGADSGWANLTVNVSAVPPPNLTVGTIDVTTSAGYDETTNAYDSVGVNSEVLNGGASDAGNSTVRIELDYNNDGTIDQTDTVSVPALTVGDTVPVSTTFSDVPIGSDHRVIVTADADDDVVESPPAANENDNVRSSLIDVIPPDPGLVLTADDEFVRWNQDTVVRWQFTNAVFPMNCAVSGPQISLPDFDPSLAGAPTSAPTQPLTATALYEIVCTEPITGASWRDTVKVENFGTTEEL